MKSHPSDRGGQQRILDNISTIVSSCFVTALFVSGMLWVWSGRSLYGDGSNLLMTILQTKMFFHVSDTRIFSTFITQLPVVLAIAAGVRSMPALIAIYTIGMAYVPLLCHAASIWISRRDPIMFSATVFVVVVCFYPMSFLLVGEGNVYLALCWLSFVLIMTGSVDSPYYAALLLLLSCAAIKTYETSVFFSLVLATLCAARLAFGTRNVGQLFIAPAMLLFLAGAWSGFSGAYFPRDAGNEHGFMIAVMNFWQNGTLEGILLLTLMGIASAFAPGRWLRIGMMVLTFGGAAFFVYSQMHMPALLSLGYVVYQRAQSFVILGGILTVIILSRFSPNPAVPNLQFNALALVIPFAAIVFLDAYDSIAMHGYLNSLCPVLEANGPGLDPHFFESAAARKFGWSWTFPIVSALIRPAGSRIVIVDRTYHGWVPYNPERPIPEIETFKRGGSFCKS
jgi:hypothetical protein